MAIISKYIKKYQYENQSQSINYVIIGKFVYNIKKYTNLIVNIFSTRGNFKIFWPILLQNMSILAYGNAAKSDSAPRTRKNPTSRMEFPVVRRTEMSPMMLGKFHRSAWRRSSEELFIVVGDQC